MLNAAMLRFNKYERKKAFPVLLARVTQQKVATVFGVQRINVRLHQLGSADYSTKSGRPQITINSQIGRLIRF